jgi:hypothetical protein
VFEETAQDYLAQVAALVESGKMAQKAADLGVRCRAGEIRIRFLNQEFTVTLNGIFDADHQVPAFPLRVVLFRYLLHENTHSGTSGQDRFQNCRWTAYKEFRDAAPLIHYFAHDAEGAVIRRFSGRLSELSEVCRILGGAPPDGLMPGDLAMRVPLLPRVPVCLVFHEKDAEFPAACSLLFEARAGHYLDMESLAILGVIFAERLAHALDSRLTNH